MARARTGVAQYPTSGEAIEHAGLNYQVQKAGLNAANLSSQNAGQNAPVPNFYATMRTDNGAVLGVVGEDYQIVQNRDAFTFFDSIVGGDGIMYETAGALGKGERIFITAKLLVYIKFGNNELIEKYLFLTTSHDGSGSITVAFTPVRIVCANTMVNLPRNSMVKLSEFSTKGNVSFLDRLVILGEKTSSTLVGCSTSTPKNKRHQLGPLYQLRNRRQAHSLAQSTPILK